MAYRKDREGGYVARMATPGRPANRFDSDETPDLPNIVPGPPPRAPARYLTPAEVLIARPLAGGLVLVLCCRERSG